MARYKQTWLMLQYHKEGILIGAATGFIAAYYLLQKGADLNLLINSGKGLLDYAMARSAPVEIATYKFYGVLTAIGATIGLIFDMLISRFSR